MFDIWKEGVGFIGKQWEEVEECHAYGYKTISPMKFTLIWELYPSPFTTWRLGLKRKE